jgi:putative permease
MMPSIFRKWIQKYFSSVEAVAFSLLLVVAVLVILTMGHILAPVFTAIILAFLMQGTTNSLVRVRIPETFAVMTTYAIFIGIFFWIALFLVPLAFNQGKLLLTELPTMLHNMQAWLDELHTSYPELITEVQIKEWMATLNGQIGRLGQQMLAQSVTTITTLFGLVIYLILVPLLVFFFLKDKATIFNWLGRFLPSDRPFMSTIWEEMNRQAANYVRGKMIEIIIVGVATYIAFFVLGLNYAALLAILVGLSVLIPYIGAAVVTIPVLAVGFYQWGWGEDFYWLFGAYMFIQAVDGNIIVPLLFSEAVNLHPIAIILAALVFGGLWGFWGVFFAIPLATLIKALIYSWPRARFGEEAL